MSVEVTNGLLVRTVISVNEMYCHDVVVMSSSPDRAEFWVSGRPTSVLSRTYTKI